MAYVRYVEEETASEEVQALYEEIKGRRGKVVNSFKLLAHRPPLLRRLFQLLVDLRTPWGSQLTNGLKELIHLRVSAYNRCGYCLTHSYHLARAFRREEEEILQISRGRFDGLQEHERVALEFAEKMLEDRVDEASIHKLRAHYSEAEIVELVLTVGVFVLLNLFNRTLKTDPDLEPGPAELYSSSVQ